MRRAANPFAPPAPGSEPAGGCLTAAVAGALLLAALGLAGAVASPHAWAPRRPNPVRLAPPAGRTRLAVSPRLWGEIRARYRLKDMTVPA